ncbi:type II toxin-antitoxin system RelE/ParE family toxin [Bosea sp. (in: a-proteobacteria)]|uniref:type II toxin-antitoxin system RelE/ParE family toxin n=1 Tax=Bosea sp. (in: a-proteobacteria) TaxID=1871050 RepID=UPI0026344266|nr:type II toxin-antitoxin system RelE/ParE family toxin [Bosea sp. (in: a-proteobacteria)]MCO5092666.1 type II toxin-antitoxin system RelE/ParE family toxin [Bosea sp. (in: a-proteobacteria)]
MLRVIETIEFADWFGTLRDVNAKARISIRIRRAQDGNLGDVKFFDGIGEMRIDYGPGYRVYFVKRGNELVILLCGGDKGSQRKDIKRAIEIAKEV